MRSRKRNTAYYDYLIDEIMAITERDLEAYASSLLVLDDEKKELRFLFVKGPASGILKGATVGTETGIVGWVARNGEPVIVNNAQEDQRFCRDMDEITTFATKSILCVPLMLKGKVIGVIEVLNKWDGSGFDERDLETLKEVAKTAAKAIELKQIDETLQSSEERYFELVGQLTDREFKLFNPYFQFSERKPAPPARRGKRITHNCPQTDH
jgi:sigma-B regulation protein RsbU (phosphoserine phosphatase)